MLITELLLENMPNLEAGDAFCGTELSWAAIILGHETIVKLLFYADTNKNSLDDLGETPLSLALQKGHETVANSLR
jgi:hypothetical protein